MTTSPKLCDPTAVRVQRSAAHPAQDLHDADGDLLWSFPAHWTETDIAEALAFANHAFQRGHLVGRRDCLDQLRQFLDLD